MSLHDGRLPSGGSHSVAHVLLSLRGQTPDTMSPMELEEAKKNLVDVIKRGDMDTVLLSVLRNPTGCQEEWIAKELLNALSGGKKVTNSSTPFSDPGLASTLIQWSMEDSDMDPGFKEIPSFSRLDYGRNKSARKLTALACLHYYAAGEIGGMPQKNYGKFERFQKTDQRKYKRGMEMAYYLVENCQYLSMQGFDLDMDFLLHANFYEKLEHWQRNVGKGLFDPLAPQCESYAQCSGVYWKQYRKFNKVRDGLYERAVRSNKLLLGEKDLQEFHNNNDLLYLPSRTVLDNVMERAVKSSESQPRKRKKKSE